MANRKATMTHLRAIIREFCMGTPMREIERKLGISRTSVVDAAHLTLNRGFVPGVQASGRYHGKAVMIAHILKGLVQSRFVDVRLDDSGFQVIGDYDLGDTAQIFKTHPDAVDEVLHLLGLDTQDVGIVSIWQRGDKDLCFHDLARGRVNVLECVSCKVDEQFLSGFIPVCKNGNRCLLGHQILLQVEEELALAVAVRMLLDVLLPQKEPGYMRDLELFDKVGQLLQELRHARVCICRAAGEKATFEDWIVQCEKFVNAQCVKANLAHIFIDRTLVDTDFRCDVSV